MASMKQEPSTPNQPPVKPEANGDNQPIADQQQAPQHQSGGPHGGPRRGGPGGRFGGGPGGRRPNPNFQPMKNEGGDFNNRKRPMGGRPMGGMQRGDGGRSMDDRIMEKLSQMVGPTYDLPPLDATEKKFSGRSRLYLGNLANETNDEDLTDLFKPYGETSELFLNKEKNFGFIKMDYHANADKAKHELDGTLLKGRQLRIRFAPIGASLKVKNLTPFVSNELLYVAFSIFGEVERCQVVVDDRGKSTGEGVVDFVRKNCAQLALRKCQESCFFLTSSLRPCIVEPNDVVDDADGYPEKSIPRKNPDYMKARDVPPRMANPGTFEHEYGTRWKQMHELYTQKLDALTKEMEMEKEKLEAQMEYARYEHETEMLREQLRSREMDRDRQKREWEMKERQAEEARKRAGEHLRRQEDNMQARMQQQDDELRRRQQENNLFMQAHQLDSMLDQEEQAYEPNTYNAGLAESGSPMDPKQFMDRYDRGGRFENRGDSQPGQRQGGGRGGGGGGTWINEGRGGPAGVGGGGGGRDDFANKRRRF